MAVSAPLSFGADSAAELQDVREPICESVATADDEVRCEDFGNHKLHEARDPENQVAGAKLGFYGTTSAIKGKLFNVVIHACLSADYPKALAVPHGSVGPEHQVLGKRVTTHWAFMSLNATCTYTYAVQVQAAMTHYLGLQQLREKQAATSKLHEAVANNKKRYSVVWNSGESYTSLSGSAANWRSDIASKKRNLRSCSARKPRRARKFSKSSFLATTWPHAADSNACAGRSTQVRGSETVAAALKKINARVKKNRVLYLYKRGEPSSLPSRPKPSAPPQRPDSKRPLSARTPSSAALPPPEILRQRAQMYGDVVSKIYVAEASRHPLPPPLTSALPQSHYLARRCSNFRKQSAMTSNNDTDSLLSISSPMTNSNIKHHLKPEWKLHSDSSKQGDSTSVVSGEGDRELVDGISTACTTLVMRNAALAVSERISIPTIRVPIVNESNIPAYVIEAQYLALDSYHKQKFRERFNLKRVSHRLSYTMLKQFTKIVRRDVAWEEFHDAAARGNGGHPCGRIRHLDFISIAQHLGITLSAKKLLLIARMLDGKKNGFVEWENFYPWRAAQYEDHVATART
ncbi:hypothetical protein FI667_g4601, partial [Globisporangium splendens]